MSKVVRYFHLRSGPKGGATVRVTGDLDIVGQEMSRHFGALLLPILLPPGIVAVAVLLY